VHVHVHGQDVHVHVHVHGQDVHVQAVHVQVKAMRPQPFCDAHLVESRLGVAE